MIRQFRTPSLPHFSTDLFFIGFAQILSATRLVDSQDLEKGFCKYGERIATSRARILTL
jgi:hypothetical protein